MVWGTERVTWDGFQSRMLNSLVQPSKFQSKCVVNVIFAVPGLNKLEIE